MAAPAVAGRIATQHEDLVHDVAYDFYGKRLATCGADQKIKVWDMDDATGAWSLSAEWKAHSGAVFRVAWAHPEFGHLLVSCSYDRTAIVWEEVEEVPGKSKWVKQRDLVDSRGEVTDVRFAPRHLGLRLATCSADGLVRLYEAADVMDLAHWSLVDELDARGAKCIAFNPSPFSPPALLVGYAAAGAEGGVARLWEQNEAARKWLPLDGGLLAGHGGDVTDVAWAPPMGRSFHLLATASRDKTVRIWRVDLRAAPPSAAPAPASAGAAEAGAGGSRRRAEVKEVACLRDHQSEVWRVEWNVTGTVLASSGDDGQVRLWRASLQGVWAAYVPAIAADADE